MPIAPALETVQLTRIIDKVKRPARFLKNTAFSVERMLAKETIQVGRRNRARQTAPFVLPGSTALVVGGRERSEERITLPNIRIKTPINPGDLTFARDLNEDPFSSQAADVNRALSRRTGEVQLDLDNDIANTEEWMCSKALFEGLISYSLVGGDSFTIDFQKPAQAALAGAALWTASTAFPEKQFSEAQRFCSDQEGVAITDCVLGSEAADAFVQNEGVQRRLDNERYDVGSLTLMNPYIEDGSVRFIGRYGTVRVWEYIRSLDVAGTSVNMVRPKYAEFFSTNRSAEQEFNYAPITDDFDAIRQSRASRSLVLQGGGVSVKRFSKSWQTTDPTSLWILMQSRPMPITHRPAASYSIQVVA